MKHKLVAGMIALTTFVLVLLILMGPPRNYFPYDLHIFGIGGAPILCVPDTDMDELARAFSNESIYLKPGSGHMAGFGAVIPSNKVKAMAS